MLMVFIVVYLVHMRAAWRETKQRLVGTTVNQVIVTSIAGVSILGVLWVLHVVRLWRNASPNFSFTSFGISFASLVIWSALCAALYQGQH